MLRIVMRAILMVGDVGSGAGHDGDDGADDKGHVAVDVVDDDDGDDVHKVKRHSQSQNPSPRNPELQDPKPLHPKKLVSEALVPEGIRQGQGLAPWAQEHGLAVGLRWVLIAVLRLVAYGYRLGFRLYGSRESIFARFRAMALTGFSFWKSSGFGCKLRKGEQKR